MQRRITGIQKITKHWLSIWLYVITLISGMIIGLVAANWSDWNLQTKLVALTVAMLPIHVLEEWRFPGGFHYMYNVFADSKNPDRYPMNQLSDMWTNWIGVIVGCVILIIGVNPMTAIMQMMLGFGEVMARTKSGFKAKKIYADQGKKTIYNPGLFTSLFGFLTLCLGILYTLIAENRPTILQMIGAIILGGILMAVALPSAEKLCKSKITPYGYDWGDGYFDRFH